MQRAITAVRVGVLEAESGAAALQAVNEEQSPRQIALTWFKTQMSVPAAIGISMNDEGPWGLSWFHLATMAFLVAFLLGAILIHYARLRRIDGLVQRLTPGTTPAAPVSAKEPSAPAGAAAIKPGPAGAGGPKSNVASASPVPSGAVPQPSAPSTLAQKPTAADATPPAKSLKPWSGALRVADIFYETANVKTFRLTELKGGGPSPSLSCPVSS